MWKIMLSSITALLCVCASAQSTSRPAYWSRATIEHKGSVTTITANDSEPLLQAIRQLREEYGLQLSYEAAPVYSHLDIADDTDPKWRVLHPNAKGVTRSKGGTFASTVPEISDTSGPADKGVALTKLVQDYNSTDNPGRYNLRRGSDSQFTVVGAQVRGESGAFESVVPVLDTLLTVSDQQQSVYQAVHAILDALSAKIGKRVILMSMPVNEFTATQVTLTRNETPARELLKQAFEATHRPLLYDLGYDPDVPVYILNISVAMKAKDDGLGHRRLIAIDSPLNR